MTEELKRDIYLTARPSWTMRTAFIDLAFEDGAVEGMTAQDIKAYIRFIADWRLRQLGLASSTAWRRTRCPG